MSRLVTLVGGAVAIVVLLATPARAQKSDAREVKARELFGIGRYPEALEIYGKLYAETTHPTYMRNIGRCYQNMGEPDKAISSFREYLRQAANLAPDQRAQVEGYIREMEELKRQRATAAGPPATTAPTTPTTTAPPPVGATPPAGSPLPNVVAPPATAPPSSPPSSPPSLVGATGSDAGTRPAPAGGNRRRVAGFVVAGATVAALATGAIFGARAFSKRHASDSQCPPIDGIEHCTDEGVRDNEQAKTAARVSDVAFGVGLVGAAVASYLLLTSRSGDATAAPSPGTVAPTVRLSPALGPAGAGLVLGAAW